MQPSNENSVGPVIGVIIILALIVLGGLYFWGMRDNGSDLNSPSTAENSVTGVDEVVSAIEDQSSSDEIESIEDDLNETNTDSLDSQLNGA